MDFARSFSHMFKDGSWFFKVFLGGLILLLCGLAVGLPLILGYQIRHITAVSRHDDTVLPEWKNLKAIFKDGLVVLAVTIIYLAAGVWLTICLTGTRILWPAFIVTALVMFVWEPIVLIQYARRRTFLACFSIREMMTPLARHPITCVIATAVSTAVMLATILFGWMSLILGWPFVVFWGVLVQSHIYGQLSESLGSPRP